MSMAKAKGSMGHVLIIDDEELVLRTARRILERFGYTVTTAQGGAAGVAAYAAAAEGAFDLVVLDLSMPEVNGAECFKQIRALDAEAAVLICTGYGAEAHTVQMLADGAKGMLRKPFEPAELVDAVAKLGRRD